MFWQFGSVRAENISGISEVFVTTISYWTTWPIVPDSSKVVNGASEDRRWSFSIVKSAS